MLESFLFEKSNHINNLQNQDASKTPIESHPHEKCDANCDARAQKSAPHLWLRNNVFYCRIELPRVDGKRRYKRFSLHTNNYYEAKTLMDQQQYIEHTVLNVHKLFDKMLMKACPDAFNKSMAPKEFMALLSSETFAQKVASNVDKADFKLLSSQVDILKNSCGNLDPFQQEVIKLMRQFLDQLTEINTNLKKVQVPSSGIFTETSPKYLLEYVLSIMLQKKDICAPEKARKRNTLTKMFEAADLTLKSEYDTFNTPEKISIISDYIQSRTDLQGDAKRKYVRYLQEFMKTANRLKPECYKLNLMELLPDIKKTNKGDKNPHLPYSKEQLLNIFDPKHDFFRKNPDLFWICMIALFTGARRNAASTLQYKDIVVKDGFNCIHFTEEGSKIKHLKNEASTRFVPIHNQLYDLGFIDFVNNRKKQLKAQDLDFIFPRCKTKSGNYSDKLIVRTLTQFLLDIKVKSGMKDGYDFHSFRKNASLIMQAARIPESFVNDIIGWEGQTIMTHSYSNHTLTQIKDQLDRFQYDFLKFHFAEWKAIMSKTKF